MNISLTPTMELFVQQKVDSGLYSSVSEVIREAVRLLITKETISPETLIRLNKDIEEGLNDIEEGHCKDGHEVMRRLMAKYE